MNTWRNTRDQPRPNVRRIPLDPYERALIDDPESSSHDLMLAIVFTCIGVALLSLVVCVGAFFVTAFFEGGQP